MSSCENIVQTKTSDDSTISVEDVTKEDSIKNKSQTFNRKTSNKILFFIISSAYFCWATVHFLRREDANYELFKSTTCSGYGFFVIVFGLYYWSLFYYIFLKPFVLPPINKFLWKPAVDCLHKLRYSSIIGYASILVAIASYLAVDTNDNRRRLIPLLGLAIFLSLGFICSANRSKINWNTVLWGIFLQFGFGLVTIRWGTGRNVFECIGDKANAFFGYGFKAASFAYGEILVDENNIFAFKSLSTIYLTSFLVNILYHYGVMQKFLKLIGEVLQWFMDTSICESVNSAANIFIGMTEGVILISPYLKDLTDSEVNSLLTSGFATVAGATMAAYVQYGARAQDLITASVMSAPAALCISKLLYPETEEVKVTKKNLRKVESEHGSVLDAAAQGASTAAQLVIGIISGVIAFLAFVYLINGILSWLGMLVGFEDEQAWTLELIAGKIFTPVSWVMGVPWNESEKVGRLIGIKTMVNEFVAYREMGLTKLTARTKIIATYAICGFSNPGSVGIMMSVFSSLAPNKREFVCRNIFRAFFGGAMVCCMTACIAGMLMPESALEGIKSANVTMS